MPRLGVERRRQGQHGNTTAISTVPQVEDVDLDPTYIVGLFKDHTDIQAQKLIENYIGKWTQISGTLSQVSAFNESAQVTFERWHNDSPDPYMRLTPYMYFHGKQWVDRLSMMRRGTPIKVRGRITGINSAVELRLDDCELQNP